VGDVSVALGRVIGVIVLGRHGGATVAAAGSAAARRAVVSSWGGRVVSCVCGVAAVVFFFAKKKNLFTRRVATVDRNSRQRLPFLWAAFLSKKPDESTYY
jgi:hypothetical protein